MIDWGPNQVLPCKIWGFVDLTEIPDDLPRNQAISYGDLARVDPGLYAIVESGEYVYQDEVKKAWEERSYNNEDTAFMQEIKTEVRNMDKNGFVTKLKFYLADVEAFHGTATVVPHIGGPNNHYFSLASRETWKKEFTLWLEDVHGLDKMDEEPENPADFQDDNVEMADLAEDELEEEEIEIVEDDVQEEADEVFIQPSRRRSSRNKGKSGR